METVLGARAVQLIESSAMSAGWKVAAVIVCLHPRVTAMKSDLRALQLAVPELFRPYVGAGRKRVLESSFQS